MSSTITMNTINDTMNNYDYEPDYESGDDECLDTSFESYDGGYLEDWEPEPYFIPLIETKRRSVRAPRPINTKSLSVQKAEDYEKEKMEKLEKDKALFLGYVSSLGNRQVQEGSIMPWGEKLSYDLVEYLKNNSSLIVSPATALPVVEKIEEVKDLSKTALCRSVIENGTLKPHCGSCKIYKDTCRYAHNLEEISFRPCGFGGRCNTVYRESATKYCNRGKKVCRFIHPSEDVGEYFKRIGVKVTLPEGYKPTIAERSSVDTARNSRSKYTTVTMSDFCNKIEREPKKAAKRASVIVKVRAAAPVKKVIKPELTKTRTVSKAPTPEAKVVEKKEKKVTRVEEKWTTIKKSKKNKTKNMKTTKKETKKETKHSLCKHLKNCRYGDKCGWAHSLDELKPCRFGNKCRNVEKKNGVYVNKKNCRKCTFKHPEETLRNICSRMK